MANYYVSSVKWATFATWAASTAYSIGDKVKRPGSTSIRIYICEVAGTSGASEPSWNVTPNATLNDNGITWRCITCVPSYGWDGCAPTLSQAQSIPNAAATDFTFVDSSHDELNAGIVTGTICISVNSAGSVPPVIADYQRGAKCRITTSGTMQISSGKFYGMDFVADTGSSSGSINANTSNGGNLFSDCLLHLKNTNVSSRLTLSGTLGGLAEWTNNTKVRFGGNTSQTIEVSNVALLWTAGDASDSVSSDGSIPIALFAPTGNNGTPITVRGVDLTGFTGTRFITSDVTKSILFEDCLLADGPIYTNGTAGSLHPDGGNVRFINCSRVTGPTKQSMFTLENYYQKVLVDKCVLSDTPDLGDGKACEQHRLTTTNAGGMCSRGLILKKYNKSIGSLTATIRGVFFGASLPHQGNFFLSLSYPKNANDSLSATVYDLTQRMKTTATVTDSSDWTSGAPARANSTAYTFGDFIKVASNPGKIFFRETSGTSNSAASEPAGFATATPGSTVTDSGITWRCGIPFKMQVTFTPARAGYVKAQAMLYPDTGTVVYCILNTKLEIA